MKKKFNYLLIILLFALLCLLYEHIQYDTDLLYWRHFFLNYLEAYVQTQRIRLEDCKGYVDLYYVHKSKNKITEKVTASYPIELLVIYDINDFNDISLLKTIIDNRFTNCSNLSEVQMCKLLVIDKDNMDYLKGEILKGKYKNKPFKFMYFIQDMYGQRLDEIDKFWPPLTRIINKIQMAKSDYYGKLVNKHLNDGHLFVKLRLEPKTLKIRNGISTAFTLEKDLILNYYIKNHKLKPMVVFYYDGGYQLIAIDLPMNQFYVNTFKRFHKHNLEYLQKIYKFETVEERWSFTKKWLYKYDSYDRKYKL